MPRYTSSLSSGKVPTCNICGKVLGRKAELIRHAKTHAENLEDLKIPCPYDGCDYRTLQKSNVETHIVAIHLKEKPHTCSVDGCSKAYADPAALIRHEKTHGIYRNGKDRPKTTIRSSRLTKPYARPTVKREASPEVTIGLNAYSSASTSGSPTPGSTPEGSFHTSQSPGSSSSTFSVECPDDLASYPDSIEDLFADLFPSLSFPIDYSSDIPLNIASAYASPAGLSSASNPSSSFSIAYQAQNIDQTLTLPPFPPSPLFNNAETQIFNQCNPSELPYQPLSSTNSTPPTFNTSITEWVANSNPTNIDNINIPFYPNMSSYLDAASPWSSSDSSSLYSSPVMYAEDFGIPEVAFDFDEI